MVQIGKRLRKTITGDGNVSHRIKGKLPFILKQLFFPMERLRKTANTETSLLSPEKLAEGSFLPVFPLKEKVLETGRGAVFASFSADGIIHPYIIYYLQALRSVCDWVIFVADNSFADEEIDKIRNLVDEIICERHGEYDFGSYKRGIQAAIRKGLFEKAEELILCNDSCYGPVSSVESMLEVMAGRECDFWGITSNTEFSYHLQSYFLVFKKSILQNKAFIEFFYRVKKEKNVKTVVLNYEVPLTKYFEDIGFKSSCFLDDSAKEVIFQRKSKENLTFFPEFLLKYDVPFLKVKAFQVAKCNFDGVGNTLKKVFSKNKILYENIIEHSMPDKFFGYSGVRFSIILPFCNGFEKLVDTIESVVAQSHQGYELILIDNGSEESVTEKIVKKYSDEFLTGHFKLFRNENNQGICAARNAGVAAAHNPWITYLDAGKNLKPNSLAVFAERILDNPHYVIFQCRFQVQSSGEAKPVLRPSRKRLLKADLGDLGIWVHSKQLFEMYGGFNTGLKQLVDRDLLIRYTKIYKPFFIWASLMVYNDTDDTGTRMAIGEI